MTLEQWLQEYDLSHRHPVNIRIHKICVPAIVFALLGLLSSVPAPLNPAWLAVAAGLAFYWRLGRTPALAMAAMCLPMLLALEGARRARACRWPSSLWRCSSSPGSASSSATRSKARSPPSFATCNSC
ncbi:DUF962 domain-containing protein [Chromobacterium haemolyticum]|nr:DUF962 domain-containing protein [Chromobacterium haemolyticum]